MSATVQPLDKYYETTLGATLAEAPHRISEDSIESGFISMGVMTNLQLEHSERMMMT